MVSSWRARPGGEGTRVLLGRGLVGDTGSTARRPVLHRSRRPWSPPHGLVMRTARVPSSGTRCDRRVGSAPGDGRSSTTLTRPATRRDPAAGGMPRRARRAQLLDSALEVFVAQGYHAAAMDDIAERAGVSKPVLYQHFPGKLDLYLALLEQSCDTIIDNAARRSGVHRTTTSSGSRPRWRSFYDYVASDAGRLPAGLRVRPDQRARGARAGRPGHRRECADDDRRGHPRGHRPARRGVPAARGLPGGNGPGQRPVLARRTRGGISREPTRPPWSPASPGAASAATRSPTSTDRPAHRPARPSTTRARRRTSWRSRSASSTPPASSSSTPTRPPSAVEKPVAEARRRRAACSPSTDAKGRRVIVPRREARLRRDRRAARPARSASALTSTG